MNFLSYPGFLSTPNDIGTDNRYIFRSGQNFQRAYASANEDPDLVNMVLLSSGKLIAAGAYTSQQLQPVLIGLSPEGNLLWQRGMNPPLQQNNAFSAFKMLALPNGNALVLFVNLNTVMLPPVFIQAKVLIAEVSAADGTFVWQRYLGDEDAPVVYNDAVLLADGILLTGYVSKQYSLAKISYQGDLIWQKNFSGPDPSEAYRLGGLITNSQGEIYAVGKEYFTKAFSLHKFDSAGNPIWSQRYKLAAPEDDRIFFEVNIALSADQQPVLWGTSADPGPVNSRVFLLEINRTDGQVLQSKRWGIAYQAPPGFTVLDSIFCPGECLRFRLDSVFPSVSYAWTFEGGTPSKFSGQEPPPVCFQQAGMFNVRVNIEGCSAFSDSILSIGYKSLLVPNAFTPNGDGLNDLFKPIIRCPTVTYLLRVYNRWGQRVFETADAGAGWDGRFEGAAQPSDLYVWTVEISDVREEGVVLQSLRGDVTLLR